MTAKDFTEVFGRLQAILEPYASSLVISEETKGRYSLDTSFVQANRTRLYFGGVRIGKRYVSFHLMPVYLRPELLDGISPALRKRMQGESCFNFSAVDEALFAELAELTAAGFRSYEEGGYISS